MPIQTSTELAQKTEQQLARLAELVGGRPWGASVAKPRIYMPTGRRDATAYFEFTDYPTGDDADLLGGAALQVFLDDCGQAPAWYRSQRTKLMGCFVEAADRLEAERRPADDGLHGKPVTWEAAKALRPGQTCEFWHGGEAGEANSERSETVTLTAVTVAAAKEGMLCPDPRGEIRVEARRADGGQICFYTWRGLLRCGGGAEVVRIAR